MAIRSVSVRMEQEMLDKLTFVADYNGRSLNSHILVLIRSSIKRYEEQFGKIEGEISPGDKVKLPRKSQS